MFRNIIKTGTVSIFAISLVCVLLFSACSFGKTEKIKRFSEDPEKNEMMAINRESPASYVVLNSENTENPTDVWEYYEDRGTFYGYKSADGKYGSLTTIDTSKDSKVYRSYFGVKYEPNKGYVETVNMDLSPYIVEGEGASSSSSKKKVGRGYIQNVNATHNDVNYVEMFGNDGVGSGNYYTTIGANSSPNKGYLETVYEDSTVGSYVGESNYGTGYVDNDSILTPNYNENYVQMFKNEGVKTDNSYVSSGYISRVKSPNYKEGYLEAVNSTFDSLNSGYLSKVNDSQNYERGYLQNINESSNYSWGVDNHPVGYVERFENFGWKI